MLCWAPILPELSAMVSEPWIAPSTAPVGAKDTETVQLDPAIKLAGQVVASTNPVLGVKARLSGLPPKLVMSNCWAGLVVPMFCLANDKEAGKGFMAGGSGLG